MRKKDFFKYALCAIALSSAMVSCSDDEDATTGGSNVEPTKTAGFIVASSDATNDMGGGAYLKAFSTFDGLTGVQSVYGATDATQSNDGFTQFVYNSKTKTYGTFIYARVAGAEYNKQAGCRFFKYDNGKLTLLGGSGELDNGSRFNVSNSGQMGTFGDYIYSAQISSPVVTIFSRNDDNISKKEVGLDQAKITKDGIIPSITAICDLGNNKVLISLKYAAASQSGGGKPTTKADATTVPERAAIVFADYDLNITSDVIEDSRIGATVAQTRSVVYRETYRTDNGDVYLFSGAATADNQVGVLRVKNGEEKFDTDYKFDIYKASGNYRFKGVYYIGGDNFLLSFAQTSSAMENMAADGKWAVVDVVKQTVTWVTGIPAAADRSWGYPDGANGVAYLPAAAPNSFSGGSSAVDPSTVTPAIYKINADGTASVAATFSATDMLKAVSVIRE